MITEIKEAPLEEIVGNKLVDSNTPEAEKIDGSIPAEPDDSEIAPEENLDGTTPAEKPEDDEQ